LPPKQEEGVQDCDTPNERHHCLAYLVLCQLPLQAMVLIGVPPPCLRPLSAHENHVEPRGRNACGIPSPLRCHRVCIAAPSSVLVRHVPMVASNELVVLHLTQPYELLSKPKKILSIYLPICACLRLSTSDPSIVTSSL
jgi:hypothetical protein